MLRKIYHSIRRNVVTEETIDFGRFKLTINSRDGGGLLYKQPAFWADVVCPIQRDIVRRFRPKIYLDIGANYGFSALTHFSNNPDCFIIAVEPSPSLIPFLKRNLEQNNCTNVRIINAICSDQVLENTDFSLNPDSSQDNRVIGQETWKRISVPSVTIDHLIGGVSRDDFVYVKIDTQGSEEKVFRGAKNFLQTHKRWIIKTEFAPKWLRSQNSDPVTFIQTLTSTYIVAELPKRSRFKGDTIEALLRNPLTPHEVREFVDYVEMTAKGEGWCDLLVWPR